MNEDLTANAFDTARPDVEPADPGISGNQALAQAGTSVVASSGDSSATTHVGALLRDSMDDQSPFLKAVTFAALQDAEASRRFLERQLHDAQSEAGRLRERLEKALRELAVLRTLLSVRSSQEIIFGVGAAMLGAALGVALVDEFALWHVTIVVVGLVLMFLAKGTTPRTENE